MYRPVAVIACLLTLPLFAAERTPLPLGQKVADFKLADVRGKQHASSDWKEQKLLVVAFVGTECPLAKQYAARLVEIAAKYKDQGVQVVAIDANQQDSLAELTHFEKTFKIEFPLLKDPGNLVADQFAAERTPEVFLLDADRKLRYRGRIDDQFTYGKQRPAVEKSYLTDAIDELLAGKEVSVKETESIGCHIGRVLKPKADSAVTYSNQIARIFNQRCVECHRPGEIGPFTLTSYEDVVGWAEMIDEVVSEERMPPWSANPAHGKFANDPRLTSEEKKLIHDWVAAGAPEGDRSQLPEPPKFVEGWRIGKPDQVIYMSDKAYKVPARGEVKYQYFIVDPGFKEDKWVQKAECRPGNRAVVHHIIVGIVPGTGRGRSAAGLDSDWLTATAPGARPLLLDDGMAKLIPAGSKIVFQMHYTPNGTAQEDRSCVGFVFADPKKVKREVATQKASTQRFVIPPGDGNHKVEADFRFSKDSLMLAMFPHMHLRGKAFRYEAIYPDGKTEMLLDVPRYDFAWQHAYAFEEPKKMPAGTRIHCTAWFDNSEENLANPDPKARVRWGDQTWEEMMIGYFDMAFADQDLTKPQPKRADEFLARYEAGAKELDKKLSDLALKATESDANFRALGLELRTQFPQVDRMCLVVLNDLKTIEVKYVIQEPRLARIVGGAGIKFTAAGTGMVDSIQTNSPTLRTDLSKDTRTDMQHMAKAYSSSIHFPVMLGEQPAAISFWSTETDAFPKGSFKLLEELTKKMMK
jgi:peroxiredoxin